MHKAPLLSARKKLLFACLPFLFVAGAIETATRIYVRLRPVYHVHRERLTNPAYTSRPWFSERFLTASFRQPGGWRTPTGTRLIFPCDYQDEFFTIVGGVRRTVGYVAQRESRPRTLATLGGSTTYCSEVPDDLTYPSQLQQRLSQNPTTAGIRVVNWGVTTVNSAQEVERLKYEIARGNVPDICVLLNGVNDIMQGVINENPQGAIYETEKKYKAESLLWKLARRSKAVRVLANSMEQRKFRETPPHVQDEVRLRALAQQTADAYRDNLLEAQRVCDEHGILMLAMLQPCVHTIGRELTEQEQSIRARPQYGFDVACSVAYEYLREAIRDLRKRNVHAFDVSGAFDTAKEPILLDGVHVNDVGNGLLVDEILSRGCGLIEAKVRQPVLVAETPN